MSDYDAPPNIDLGGITDPFNGGTPWAPSLASAPSFGGGLPSWLGPVVGGGLGAAQGALSNGPQSQHVTGTDTSNQKFNDVTRSGGAVNQYGTSTGGYTPNLSPLQQSTINQLLQRANSNLNSDPNLEGYRAQQLGEIGQAADARKSLIRNTLASRGLTYSPLAGAEEADAGNQQFKSNVDLANSLPMLRQQMFQQKLGSAVNAFRAAPYGYSTTANQNQHMGQSASSTQTGSQSGTTTKDETTIVPGQRASGAGAGGIMGSILGGLGSVLGFL